jgi:hypothetical protein
MATLITKEEVLSKIEFVKQTMVTDAYPSIYSKDDVIVLLMHLADGLEACEVVEAPTSNTSNVNLQEVENRIKNAVIETINEFDYEEEIELELAWSKQINVSFDTRNLIGQVKDAIDDVMNEYAEEEEEEELQEN